VRKGVQGLCGKNQEVCLIVAVIHKFLGTTLLRTSHAALTSHILPSSTHRPPAPRVLRNNGTHVPLWMS